MDQEKLPEETKAPAVSVNIDGLKAKIEELKAKNIELMDKSLKLLDKQTELYADTVPRGAQTWEVPLHTPDILASAHMVKAYTLGYIISGREEYLEQARVEVDIAERMRRYYNFQVRFTNEMPALPLCHPIYNFGIDNSVQGVTMGPVYAMSDRFNNISSWFLLARQALENLETPTVEP